MVRVGHPSGEPASPWDESHTPVNQFTGERAAPLVLVICCIKRIVRQQQRHSGSPPCHRCADMNPVRARRATATLLHRFDHSAVAQRGRDRRAADAVAVGALRQPRREFTVVARTVAMPSRARPCSCHAASAAQSSEASRRTSASCNRRSTVMVCRRARCG